MKWYGKSIAIGPLTFIVDSKRNTAASNAMMGIDAPLLIVALVMLALGGIVKGTIGVGLPVVVIAALSNFLPVPLVLALVTMPILLTNLWQVIETGKPMEPLRRFWPMIACLIVFIWIGARFVVDLEPRVLYALVGGAVTLFVVTSYFKLHGTVSPSAEKWAGPLAGALGGLLGGVSTIWGPPMMMYFVMLRLPKDVYIQAVGLVWFIASIPLVIAYIGYGILTFQTTLLSMIMCIPGAIGFLIGQKLRRRINQELFRTLLLWFLLLVGLNLIRRAIF